MSNNYVVHLKLIDCYMLNNLNSFLKRTQGDKVNNLGEKTNIPIQTNIKSIWIDKTTTLDSIIVSN